MPAIEFLPIFPKEYNPSNQVVQYPDILPGVARDESFVFFSPKGENTIDELMRVGINRFRGGDLYGLPEAEANARIADGLGYDEVPQTQVQFSLPDRGPGASEWVGPGGASTAWPYIWNRRFFPTAPGATEPMTYSEGYDKGRSYRTNYTVYIFENSEQDHAISPHWEFVRGWAESWTAGVERTWEGTGRMTLYAWNYFTNFGVGLGSSLTTQQKKDIMRSPLSAWPASHMLPGGTLEKMNAYCIPMYWNSQEHGYETPYELAYQYYVSKKTGKKAIVFPAGALECNPTGMVRWSTPEGNYYDKSKLPQEPGMIIGAMLLARIFLKAFVPWGVAAKDTNDFSLNRYYVEQGWVQIGLWVPNGNPETQTADPWSSPLLNPGTSQHGPSMGFMDYAGIAYYTYNRTFKLTEGGTDQWLKHRKDGGAWYNPVNDWADDVVNAYNSNGLLVFSRRKSGILSVLVINPRATDCARHLVEFEFNSVIYSGYIAGHAPFVINITY